MKPNGFVAAASITSQMSIPMRSHSTASSFTSAMFTDRKMFSSSLDSSAASGAETTSTSSQTRSYRRARLGGAVLGHPADHLHGVAQREVGAARVDPLGRERDVEVASGREPGLFEQRHEPLAGRARVRRRLEHDELALAQHARQRGGGVDHRPQVGLAVLGQRRRDADHDRVDAGELVVVRGRASAGRPRPPRRGRRTARPRRGSCRS